MILVTLGTHDHPFARLLERVGQLTDEHELVIQHGHTPARPGLPARWIRFAGYDEMRELMRSATAVVSHAGVGTILTALSVGQTPVVVPRLRRYGEHVDDHQLQIARELERSGHVVASVDGEDLCEAIRRTRAVARPIGARNAALRRAIAEAVG